MRNIFKPMALVAAALFGCSVANAKDYIITDHGVVNDSTLLQTDKIQAVIDLAESEGGGTIVVPKGTYLTGGLFFKPGNKLQVQEGGCIKGSDEIENYPLIPSRMEGRSIYYYAALINAYHVDGFEIKGPGIINGNGAKYWDEFWHSVPNEPRLVNRAPILRSVVRALCLSGVVTM